MQHSKHFLNSAAMAAFLALTALPLVSAADDSSAGPVVAGAWEHRHASFSYHGVISRYSCAAFETGVGALLQYLGARKDLTVRASECPNGYNAPSRNAVVDMDFYSLTPDVGANAANSVQARWTPVLVDTTHPKTMERGDCELVEQLQDILSKNFSLRDLSYRTDCVPHLVNTNDFTIKAEALRGLPGAVAAQR